MSERRKFTCPSKSFSNFKTPNQSNWKFVKLWIISICIYIFLFLSVCDLYFKSPIIHNLQTHEGTAFAKRVVLFVADGLRYETLSKHENITKYLTKLRKEEKCAHGVVHTKVPTESRPGHAAILGGIYEDPSAIFSGWKSNLVDFDSVVNRSNYAWLFGSPDIVKLYGKSEKWKLHLECYSAGFQDFSGRGNVSDLDKWVFERVENTLHNEPGSCEEDLFKIRRYQRRINFDDYYYYYKRTCKGFDKLVGEPYCQYQYIKRWTSDPVLDRFDLKIDKVRRACAGVDVKNCNGVICEDKNIFFLHLLAMDSAGHIHKPNSKHFLDTLSSLDVGIEDMVKLFGDFFNDQETTFILTADHGMTDWGSHGDGSAMETEVPLMIWGKAVNTSGVILQLEQTDIAPLISTILGTPIPINSIGLIEHTILNGSKDEINKALLINLQQLTENYNYLRECYNRDYFFKEPPFFKNRHPNDLIEDIKKDLCSRETTLIIKQTAGEVLKGIKHLNDYYFKFKMAMVWFGFILWNIYLISSLHPGREIMDPVWLNNFHTCRLFMFIMISITAAIFAAYTFCLRASHFSYTYTLFPTIITIYVFKSDRVIYDICKFYHRSNKGTILARVLWLILLTQIIVFGFFNKYLYGITLCVMIYWMKFSKPTTLLQQLFWFSTNIALMVCLALPHKTTFNFVYFYIGISLWIVFASVIFVHTIRNLNYDRLVVLAITAMPLFLVIATALNTYSVGVEFEQDGVSDQSRWLSWILTIVSLITIPFYPNNIPLKFNHICIAFSIPYILTSTNIDLISYTILVAWLNLWIHLETNPVDISKHTFSTRPNLENNPITYEHYRLSYFYISITLTYFFAIGNLASFSGFDPLWTRAYVSTFRKNLMAALIILKLTTPFFLITCAYSAITTTQKSNLLKTFTITMIQLNQIILNFMLNIKNEGSWKDIGQSLSHFVVMEAMALILLSFYLLSLYITGFCFCYLRRKHPSSSIDSDDEKEIAVVELDDSATINDVETSRENTDESTISKVFETEQNSKIIIISSKIGDSSRRFNNNLPPIYLRRRLLSVIKNTDENNFNKYKNTDSNEGFNLESRLATKSSHNLRQSKGIFVFNTARRVGDSKISTVFVHKPFQDLHKSADKQQQSQRRCLPKSANGIQKQSKNLKEFPQPDPHKLQKTKSPSKNSIDSKTTRILFTKQKPFSQLRRTLARKKRKQMDDATDYRRKNQHQETGKHTSNYIKDLFSIKERTDSEKNTPPQNPYTKINPTVGFRLLPNKTIARKSSTCANKSDQDLNYSTFEKDLDATHSSSYDHLKVDSKQNYNYSGNNFATNKVHTCDDPSSEYFTINIPEGDVCFEESAYKINEKKSAIYPDVVESNIWKCANYASMNSATQTEDEDSSMSLLAKTCRGRELLLKQLHGLYSSVSEDEETSSG